MPWILAIPPEAWATAGRLWAAALLDYGLGDPWGWPHPVRVMGWMITQYSRFALAAAASAPTQRRLGIILAVGMISGWGLGSWAFLVLLHWVNPVLGESVGVILLASCWAGRSLRQAATEVLRPLQAGDLAEARQALSRYVGRDTDGLESPEILRAVLETVCENGVDGVLAPLFYALLGAVIPGVGSVPLAMAYKAASTLDSMVGYREAPYTNLGWASARLEDGLTWLPCRLAVLTLGLIAGRPRVVWRIARRDGPADPSPNSGWSEAAYAAVLGVRLGGINAYRGLVKVKPYVGDDDVPITAGRVEQALRLTRKCFLIWLGTGSLVILGLHTRLQSYPGLPFLTGLY
ncbi:MAG: cobalamin biosynthesis protein [Gloeomargaritaceae cyanobacterium C42_A2020_066]|nr:cobalamin biosynthesis protein [Gloeomargaritaceae cyanobacterium C42_A2020_066]